ncbi:hypothetical protein PAEPH01_2552 [Pancytospora epiphaga]|nr:hypothetical protein PAEPH01_2552 [Pancytospora epiphaga]
MDLPNRRLNRGYHKISVPTEYEMHVANYFWFVNDLKLSTERDVELKMTVVVLLKINYENLVTNAVACINLVVILDVNWKYK